MSDSIGDLPDLELLHDRHFGLTPAVCSSYTEAARVCLSRHYVSPVVFTIELREPEPEIRTRRVIWRAAEDRERAAWANADDATRDGAYGLSLAAVESERGLLAISRTESRSGTDYLVSSSTRSGSSDNVENCYRLEISGVGGGDEARVRSRWKEKSAQALVHGSLLPAIACVVGFKARLVILGDVEQESYDES